ncbi:MAG: EAL domain-containing protein, partial [Rhodospirillales bacterium]|nr:EAL domain-containing protein [Rhodospirillales bacterium]
ERMSLLVTAEGVETHRQADILRSYGCSQAQGFLFHQPLDSKEFARLAAIQHDATVPGIPSF